VAQSTITAVLLAAYGCLTYVLRRSRTVIVAALIVLAVIGALNPYKLRFPGMEDCYPEGGEIPGVEKAQIRELLELEDPDLLKKDPGVPERLTRYPLDLSAWVALDEARQEKLDSALKVKQPFDPAQDDEAVKAAKALLRDNRVHPGKDMRPLALMDRGGDDVRRLLGIDDLAFPAGEPLVVVAVSGGGLRSAAWTLRVLQELELTFEAHKPPIDFPSHVRVIAGASGGMLGAAYYVTTLKPREQRLAELRNPIALKDRKAVMLAQYNSLTKDCLTPIVRQMVFGDVPLYFSPWPAPYDRGPGPSAAGSGREAGDPCGRGPAGAVARAQPSATDLLPQRRRPGRRVTVL
jgi:hypothetical protein